MKTKAKQRLIGIGEVVADTILYLFLWYFGLLLMALLSAALIPGMVSVRTWPIVPGSIACALLWPIVGEKQ